MPPELFLGLLTFNAVAVCFLIIQIMRCLRKLTDDYNSIRDSYLETTREFKARPNSIEADELLHDLTSAHGKAMVLVQRVSLDEILLRPKRGE